MSLNRAEVLAMIVDGHADWTLGAELGVYEGFTFFHLLDHCPRIKCLMGVDRWERSPPVVKSKETGETSYATKPMEKIESVVRNRAAKYGTRSLIIKADTAFAAMTVEDHCLDFVFIDADHTTESVTKDIKAWRPKLRPGGALIGHDANWPSVQRALNQELPGWQLLEANVWFTKDF